MPSQSQAPSQKAKPKAKPKPAPASGRIVLVRITGSPSRQDKQNNGGSSQSHHLDSDGFTPLGYGCTVSKATVSPPKKRLQLLHRLIKRSHAACRDDRQFPKMDLTADVFKYLTKSDSAQAKVPPPETRRLHRLSDRYTSIKVTYGKIWRLAILLPLNGQPSRTAVKELHILKPSLLRKNRP